MKTNVSPILVGKTCFVNLFGKVSRNFNWAMIQFLLPHVPCLTKYALISKANYIKLKIPANTKRCKNSPMNHLVYIMKLFFPSV